MKTASTTAAALAIVASLLFATSGCTRKQQTAPVAQSQTQSSEATNQPATVFGCVRAGEASDTFVLTTAGENPVTYHLVGGDADTLRKQVGHQAEITGTVTAQQETATRSSAPAEHRAAGTSGTTPTVRIQTQVNMRELQVSSVRRTGTDCK